MVASMDALELSGVKTMTSSCTCMNSAPIRPLRQFELQPDARPSWLGGGSLALRAAQQAPQSLVAKLAKVALPNKLPHHRLCIASRQTMAAHVCPDTPTRSVLAGTPHTHSKW